MNPDSYPVVSPLQQFRALIKRYRLVIWLSAALLCVSSIAFLWHISVRQWFLFRAIDAESISQVRWALRLGVDSNAPRDNTTPLTRAVGRCSPPEIVRLLLDNRADPNQAEPTGHPGYWDATPLGSVRSSCPATSLVVADMLVQAGANAKACSGLLSILANHSSATVASQLIKHGADVNQRCNPSYARTPLHSVTHYPDVVALYLEHGAKVLPDNAGQTPLHLVADQGRKDYEQQIPTRLKSAELLLAHGADVNAVDSMDMTPLDYAYQRADKEMIAILTKHGAKGKNFANIDDGEAARDSETEYQDLFAVAEGTRKGPGCSLSLRGENHATMEEGPNWGMVKGTVGVVRVNCHASGFFHYAVLGMGSPVPKRLNMPLVGGIGGSEKITFDQDWSNGVMHWYYSKGPIKNLVRAVTQGDATHFAVRYVTVGE